MLTSGWIFSMIFNGDPLTSRSDEACFASEMFTLLGEIPKKWEPNWALLKDLAGDHRPGPFGVAWTIEDFFHKKVIIQL